MAIKTDKLGGDTLLAAAKTSMGSKIVGAEGDFFGKMVVEAIQAVKTTDQVGIERGWGEEEQETERRGSRTIVGCRRL